MNTKNIFISLLVSLAFPMGVLAVSKPIIDPIPSSVDAYNYKLVIHVDAGSKVTVLGGPSFVPPETDGVGNALDGVVEVFVGLSQNTTNNFSIVAELGGVFSESVEVKIKEATSTSSAPGDHTAPAAPQVDPVESPIRAYEVTLTGSSEANANIYVKRPDGSSAGSTRANSNGIFQVTVDLEPGKTNRLNVSAEDAAYNVGPATQVVIQVLQPDEPREEELITEESEIADCPFADIEGHWAKDYICGLYEKGVVSGKTATQFAPDDFITRAAMAKIAVNVFGYDVPEEVLDEPFPDVPTDTWFAPFVETAKDEAITGGFPDGTFQPEKPITRAASLKMLVTASGLDYQMSQADFPDVQQSDWFADYVGFAQQSDVVGGYADGTFRPGNPITRAEVAKMAVKLLELTQ